VVPTATTRPVRPGRLDDGGRRARDAEALGRRPAPCSSGLDTPACSTTGNDGHTADASRRTICPVNGLPALAISALPGSSANTVW
jgi:hypothetical protein